jgi:hypothetical protein
MAAPGSEYTAIIIQIFCEGRRLILLALWPLLRSGIVKNLLVTTAREEHRFWAL